MQRATNELNLLNTQEMGKTLVVRISKSGFGSRTGWLGRLAIWLWG